MCWAAAVASAGAGVREGEEGGEGGHGITRYRHTDTEGAQTQTLSTQTQRSLIRKCSALLEQQPESHSCKQLKILLVINTLASTAFPVRYQ